MRTIYKLAKLIIACFMFIACVTLQLCRLKMIQLAVNQAKTHLKTVNEEESAEKKFDINTVSDTDVLTAVPLEGE